MTYEGFLRIGGVEVVNTERARGYTTTTDCPERWVSHESLCETLRDAIGDEVYEFANIADAPWYDTSLADLSSRFYGVVGLDISGPTDSTRAASSTEGVNDGGAIGRTRKGMRGLRVRATIMARGRDALDYGSQWLSSVFDGTCSQHGDACSTTDAEFLAECPPPRGIVQDFTAWTEERRNLALNPQARDLTGWTSNSAALNPVVRGSAVPVAHPNGLTTAVMASSTGTNSVLASMHDVDSLGNAGTPERSVGVWMLVTEPGYRAYDVDLPANEWVYVRNPSAIAAGAYAQIDVGKIAGPASTTVRAYITGAMVEAGAGPVGDYFDGETADLELQRFSWTGAAFESPSIEEARSSVQRPRTDDEYALLVDPLRRFVHDIAVTSGPLDVEEFEPSRGFYGKTVEFTITSERAWVYGLTKSLTLAPTLPSVVQDVPYNLIPYPSAELASGLINTGINYSPNPSLETNATDWAAGADGTNITLAMLTSGRVTNELSAVGTSSYRIVFTATGAGTNGSFHSQQVVPLNPAGAVIPVGARASFNCWAAELLMAGAPVRPDIQVILTWRSAAAVLRVDTLPNLIPVNGGALSVSGIQVPAGADNVIVRIYARLTSWNAGTILRLYSDALAVTVP